MMPLQFAVPKDRQFRLLCLGAHCDDIPIGCGGTIRRLVQAYPAMQVRWVVFSSDQERKLEELQAAKAFLGESADSQVIIKDWRDGFLPYSGPEIKAFFEGIKSTFLPDLILTHYRDDRHQDHCMISDLTWNTYRNHLIFEYEIPKYDGDMGSPQMFMPLTEEEMQRKVSILLDSFHSQRNKHWFQDAVFRAIARLRGMEAGRDTPFAEAFYARKLMLV